MSPAVNCKTCGGDGQVYAYESGSPEDEAYDRLLDSAPSGDIVKRRRPDAWKTCPACRGRGTIDDPADK